MESYWAVRIADASSKAELASNNIVRSIYLDLVEHYQSMEVLTFRKYSDLPKRDYRIIPK